MLHISVSFKKASDVTETKVGIVLQARFLSGTSAVVTIFNCAHETKNFMVYFKLFVLKKIFSLLKQ